jgi:hypothetical protein
MKIAGPVLLVASLLAQAPPAQIAVPKAADPELFVLGVLRRDGVVSPFAAFDGKSWSAPWPEALRYLEIPITLDAVPGKWWGKAGPPAEMAIWTDGSRRGTLRLGQPATLRVMCAPRLGLTSNYRSSEPAPPPIEQPYPKDGLVISGSQAIDAIESVAPASPEWVPTAVGLMEPFDAAELAAIRAFTDWKHPMSRANRRKVPVELERMYRAPMEEPGWTAYYLEAIRRYPPGPDDGDCGLVTSAAGFMGIGPKGKRWIRLFARVTYCDRAGNTYMLPLGLIKARGKSHWIYQLSGYDREGYVVVRPTPSTIETMVHYLGGTCPR